MKDRSGNTKSLQAVSETESKVWKREECAGNTDIYCSVCPGMDGTLLESVVHYSNYHGGKLKLGA